MFYSNANITYFGVKITETHVAHMSHISDFECSCKIVDLTFYICIFIESFDGLIQYWATNQITRANHPRTADQRSHPKLDLALHGAKVCNYS